MTITHTTQTAKPNDGTKDVSANAWNEAHAVTPFAITDILSGIAAGTATVYANSLTRVVSHDLGSIPIVMLQPQSIGGVMHFVTNKTTTQFTINLAAPQELDVDFDWEAKII